MNTHRQSETMTMRNEGFEVANGVQSLPEGAHLAADRVCNLLPSAAAAGGPRAEAICSVRHHRRKKVSASAAASPSSR